MGMLDRFEKGIERAVSGAFAKAFRSEVQPIEIASALRREIDDRANIVARGRTLAPNTFVVELGPADHERLGEWEEALAQELKSVVDEHAQAQRYTMVGPVTVGFEQAEDLDTGVFRVRSTTTRRSAPPVDSGRAPDPSGSIAPNVTLEIDGRTHQLTGTSTVLGRGQESDIVVDDPGVSRRHVEVAVKGATVTATDLGSTNGTFVDGERVHSGILAEGSRITIGRTRIVVHLGTW
ncbi:FhaA domain-containing protein [Spongisporangium articulatum]|uniref:FhaA domain-containing protein n=1 Tax=Spongisporangium articulatum TaxID=3362603 RepID=A0ABW8AI66_9ACTN